jgi:hypothetical protein
MGDDNKYLSIADLVAVRPSSRASVAKRAKLGRRVRWTLSARDRSADRPYLRVRVIGSSGAAR